MEKSSYEKNQKNHQNIQSQSVQKVLFRLKQLHQVEDQSRNQLCPVFADEESHFSAANRSSISHNHHGNTHILKQLEETQGAAKRSEQGSKRGYSFLDKQAELRIVNAKLKEDNMKLFAECIRLRKKCQQYSNQDYRNPFSRKQQVIQQKKKEEILQAQLSKVRMKAEEFEEHNKMLEQKVSFLMQKQSQLNMLSQQLQQKSAECMTLSRLSENLNNKIINLQKQLQLSQSRTVSKSSSQNMSINNTTQQSRKSQVDKDRMITNLRIVHQSEVRKLKGVIEQLRKQVGESQYGLGKGVTKKR